MKISKTKVNTLCKNIQQLVLQTKQQVAHTVNVGLLYSYWHTGKLIVTLEESEGYDDESCNYLLTAAANDLSVKLGRGFSRPNLFYMRLFYMKFKSCQTLSDNFPKKLAFRQTVSDNFPKRKQKTGLTVSDQISWSHYIELLKCNYDEEIMFYMQLCIRENLAVRELRTHQKKALFERVVLSKNKKQVPYPSAKKQLPANMDDFYRDPLILEFLNISPNYRLTEKKLEQKILDNLQHFILEMGKGFAFVGRQFRISVDGKHYHVDLVFYHYILKCFVLVDLKIDEVQHLDIGQMNFYLNYFKKEVSAKDDNPPIGIILTRQNNHLSVEYALGGITNAIFIRKYQLHLPDRKLLERKIKTFFSHP
jgi:predicted nuclease of restriction endonuclease-like (RecB) superfamily